MPRKRGHDLTGANSPGAASSSSTTKRRRRRRAPPVTRPPRRTLPEDLLLEIVARSRDSPTVLRCAAASKSLRRAIVDPAFRRRRADLDPSVRRRCAGNFGFDPALLAGVYYRVHSDKNGDRDMDRVLVEPPNPSPCLPFHADHLWLLSNPLSSRDGLLVLRKDPNQHEVGLCVLDTFTGHVTTLPCPDLLSANGIYRPALLAAADDRAFELLVANRCNQAKIFSSRHGKWRDVDVHLPDDSPLLAPWRNNSLVGAEDACVGPAAVIGRAVHWLSSSTARPPLHPPCDDGDIFVLALDLHSDNSAAHARVIELPPRCLRKMKRCCDGSRPRLWCRAEGLVLLATGDGRMGLVVAEEFAVSMWTTMASPAPVGEEVGWSRQVVIRRSRIERQTGLDANGGMSFRGFGQRSGAVAVEVGGDHLVQLNLVTKKAVLFHRCTARETATAVCFHEMELASLLRHTKTF